MTSIKRSPGNRRRLWLLILLPLLLGMGGVGSLIGYWRTRPVWQLSATNGPTGVEVSIYRTGEDAPTYSTLLPGRSIPSPVSRVNRAQLPASVGQTTFFDETLPPGRWTLRVAGAELDVMPSRLVIDGRTEVQPKK